MLVIGRCIVSVDSTFSEKRLNTGYLFFGLFIQLNCSKQSQLFNSLCQQNSRNRNLCFFCIRLKDERIQVYLYQAV